MSFVKEPNNEVHLLLHVADNQTNTEAIGMIMEYVPTDFRMAAFTVLVNLRPNSKQDIVSFIEGLQKDLDKPVISPTQAWV